MDNGVDNWKFGFILPNISIKKSVGNEYIAISPPTDPRVQNLIQKYSNISYLIKGFTNQSKTIIVPSVLIRNNKFGNRHVLDSMVDFRNIYSICSVISGWQNFLNRDDGQLMPSNALWSDYFYLYPIVPHSNNDNIATISPAVSGFDQALKFAGQISPGLGSQVCDPHYDDDLYNALSKEWMNRHILQNYSDWNLSSLFRALQIAYQALSMPASNFATIYDYGTNLSLWVSAFEILAHSKSESVNVNLYSVLDLLDNSFLSKELTKRLYTVGSGSNKCRKNLVQKLYSQIYYARNSYLHGNAVKTKDMTVWGETSRHPLYYYAPLIFKVALITRTDINYYQNDKVYNQLRIEGAMLKSKIKKPKSIWDSI